MKLSDDTKRAFIAVGINFFIGAMLGVILFYSQLKQSKTSDYGIEMIHKASPVDFLRLVWMNILWFLSIFIARCTAPAKYIHPIMLIRGCVCSFTASYILNACGVAEASASIIPQCLSVLPAMAIFSASSVEKRRRAVSHNTEPDVFKRRDLLTIFLFASCSASLEILFFSLFILCLF